MKIKLLLLLSLLFPSFAAAQVGVCKPGVNCSSNTFTASSTSTTRAAIAGSSLKTTGSTTASGGGTYGVQIRNGSAFASCDSGDNCNWWNMSYAAGTGMTVSNGGGGSAAINFTLTGPLALQSNGTAAAPALTTAGDTNTGLWSCGAACLGVTTGGVDSVHFAVNGYMSGVNGNAAVGTLASSAVVAYGGSNYSVNDNGHIWTQAAAGNAWTGGVSPTAFTNVYAPREQLDLNTGRRYFTNTTTLANTPPVDIGGGQHPVLQKRTYVLDVGVGAGSAATPTFMAAPRGAAGTITVSVVDAAAATGAFAGQAQYAQNFRVSNTLAAAASTSTLTNSAQWIDAYAGPRWCQRVAIGTNPGAAISSIRVWAGMASALPGASDAPATHHASFRFSTAAGDTAWQYCYGAGATTCATTGVAPADNSAGLGAYDTLCVDCREATSGCIWWVNGVAKARVTSGLPTSLMSPMYSVAALAASARWLAAGSVSVELN